MTDASSNASLRLAVPTFTLSYALSPVDELNDAYIRAYIHDITTINTYQKANMGGQLIRSHLAKMISNFAINLGGRTPDTSLDCDFVDVSHQSEELQ